MCKKTTRRLLAGLLAVMTVLSIVSCSADEPLAPAEDVEIIQEAEPTTEAEEPAATQAVPTTEAPTEPEEPTTEEPTTEAEEPATEEPTTEAPTEPTTEEPTTQPPTEPPTEPTTEEPTQPKDVRDYVLNTNTMKFHEPSCGSAKKIKDKNRADFTGTRDEVIARGFDPCGNCHP